jgi:hypothetical protein
MLQEKHGKLEAMVAQEMRRPSPDFESIQILKKQKLLIKQELSRLQSLAEERFDAA